MIDYTKDNHIHTCYSPDADPKATFQAYIEQAVKLGLTEITFTDHVDFDAVHPLFSTMIDYDKYIEDFNTVKQDSPIPIKLGVEIGYQEHMKETINAFLNSYDFEYVILSIHYIDKQDLYTGEYFSNKTKKELWKSIYNNMASCWNGRQSGLKIQWDLFPWRFESAQGHQPFFFCTVCYSAHTRL